MSYKKLGDYIRKVNNKNKDMKVLNLQGLSMTKEFRKSTSNIVGTDLSKYKIVKQGQFCCDFMSVIRVHKLPVVLNNLGEDVIISPAYVVFEVIDENLLLPKYLMLWFRRTEFDRYADFRCDSSIRGGFQWEELCEVELPVPSLEKQREIVAQYQAVANKIKVNEQICEKLEATAQTLYKQWFVDFEFPNEEDMPYKSSGGAMVYNEELEKEIPEGWEVIELGECLETKGYIRGPFGSALRKSEMTTKGTPVYEQQHVIDNHRKFRYYIDEVKYNKLKRFTVQTNDLIISCSGTVGKINIINKEDPIGIINQALLILRFNRNKVNIHSLYFFLTSKEGNSLLTETSTGSAQINIGKKDTIYSIKILIPSKAEYNKIGDNFKKLYDKKYSKKKINKKLIQFQEVLLSRMVKY